MKSKQQIVNKVKRATENNKLSFKVLGERNWYGYFIRTTKLIWGRNLYDGYKIEVYEEQYGTHLTTVIV